MTLDCPATGTPPPAITWYKDGQQVDVTATPNLRLLPGGRQVEILRAQVEDTGRYTCKASNAAGTSELNYYVKVQGITTIANCYP